MMDFLGAFHPLILHIPIGALLAAFLLELIHHFRKSHALDQAIKILLGFTAVTAIIAALFGYFLSQKGGYQGVTLQIHQWSGIGVALLSTLFFLLKSRLSIQGVWIAWGINLLVLTVAGHFGGSLTHGEDFLIRDAPGFIKTVFSSGDEVITNIDPDSAVVFTDIIQPIVKEKCLSCHNDSKKQGSLDLRNESTWRKGGKNGDLFDPENIEQSLLLHRIFLPLDHEEHMPPEGQQQLIPTEVAMIEWWLENGMPFDKKVGDLHSSGRIAQILQSKFQPFDPFEVITADPIDESVLDEFRSNGITALRISQKSPLLEVRLAGVETIGKDKIDLMKKAKEQIVRIDFHGSGITDAELREIASFPNLVQLSLHQTNITNEGIESLRGLKYLQHLNVHSTRVSDESLNDLIALDQLKSLYVWNTHFSSEAIEQLKSARPGLDLGEVN
ncbi:MAG: hypothetical protein KI791_05890 [Cyclobacteriaceae bacterium]|nr:hypothetical protein [Cyclobacteriaceae bacterium SS2]